MAARLPESAQTVTIHRRLPGRAPESWPEIAVGCSADVDHWEIAWARWARSGRPAALTPAQARQALRLAEQQAQDEARERRNEQRIEAWLDRQAA